MDCKYQLMDTLPIKGETKNNSRRHPRYVYPGERRSILPTLSPTAMQNFVLVKTAGNALQAIPRSSYEEDKTKNLLTVNVPPNARGGDEIYVRTPSGRRSISATVPDGFVPGQVFLVQDNHNVRDEEPISKCTTAVIMGVPVNNNTSLSSPIISTTPSTAVATNVVVVGQEAHDLELQQDTTTYAAPTPLPADHILTQNQEPPVEGRAVV
ncbi:hypothetical protein ACA910_005040 [Epithemia clementina (nom. ined.)]